MSVFFLTTFRSIFLFNHLQYLSWMVSKHIQSMMPIPKLEVADFSLFFYVNILLVHIFSSLLPEKYMYL
jgi:hypothetical protein